MFIELTGVRQEGLRHHTADFTIGNQHGTVEQAPTGRKRCPDDESQLFIGREAGQFEQRLFNPALQRLLKEEISAGVTAETKFGKN